MGTLIGMLDFSLLKALKFIHRIEKTYFLKRATPRVFSAFVSSVRDHIQATFTKNVKGIIIVNVGQ